MPPAQLMATYKTTPPEKLPYAGGGFRGLHASIPLGEVGASTSLRSGHVFDVRLVLRTLNMRMPSVCVATVGRTEFCYVLDPLESDMAVS